MLHIWGRISSINVRKVVWAVQYLNLTHQRTDAGGQFGIVQTPDYLAQNPNALVPLLEDEGYSLWESNVILRYLCARHAPDTLYPQDLKARFDAERWMDWQQTTLNPAGRDAFVQLIRKPGGQVDAAKSGSVSSGYDTAAGHAGRPPGAPALHGGCPIDHGRHPRRL
jgi:glutathione S-transferase